MYNWRSIIPSFAVLGNFVGFYCIKLNTTLFNRILANHTQNASIYTNSFDYSKLNFKFDYLTIDFIICSKP